MCTGEEAVKDFWLHWEYNKRFHLRLMSFTNNRFAYLSLEHALNTLTRAYAQFYWNQWQDISFPSDTKYHKDIIAAIEERDAKKLLFTSMPTCRISAESSICQSYSQEGCL